MTQANIKYLEDHRNVVDEIVNAQTATRANAIKGELLRIMKEEFLPGYVILDSCGSCLFDLVRQLYARFDKWKETQKQNNNEHHTPHSPRTSGRRNGRR
jgi:hypothetical protein